jgi:hypothetical protein
VVYPGSRYLLMFERLNKSRPWIGSKTGPQEPIRTTTLRFACFATLNRTLVSQHCLSHTFDLSSKMDQVFLSCGRKKGTDCTLLTGNAICYYFDGISNLELYSYHAQCCQPILYCISTYGASRASSRIE